MNTYKFNKLIFALFLALALFGVVRVAGDRFFREKPAGELAYKIDYAEPARKPEPASTRPEATPAPTASAKADGAEPVAAAPAPAPVEQRAGLSALIAQSDPAVGEKKTAICRACHNFAKGGPNMMGPNLWNVVGRDKASAAGYAYSPALQALPGAWTYKDLDAFLAGPAKFAAGTKMSFAGLSNAEDRAAVIAYLRQQADSPAPLSSE